MKKSLRAPAALLACMSCMLGLFACTEKSAPPPPPAPASFTATAQVSVGGGSLTAQLRQERPGVLSAALTQPKELRGLTMELEGDVAILRYGDLCRQWSAGNLPPAGFLPLLNHALLALAQPQTTAVSDGGGWRLKGESNGIPYLLKLDGAGRLEVLSAPSQNLRVTIADYKNLYS
jgi:hypothetical protein